MAARAIRQIDHVNVLSADPARTAAVLADALALPQPWGSSTLLGRNRRGLLASASRRKQ